MDAVSQLIMMGFSPEESTFAASKYSTFDDALNWLTKSSENDAQNMNVADNFVDLGFPPCSDELEGITKELYYELQREYTRATIQNIERIRSPLQEKKFLDQRTCFRTFCNNDEVCLAFHGTKSSNLDSISDLGLLDPDHPKYVRACGNKYGKGIYVSKNIDFASRYARPSILVVAILEGENRILQPRDAVPDQPIPCNSIRILDETVLQSNSQVLPLFVLTLGGKRTLMSIPFEDIQLFNFADVLVQHMPLAVMLKDNFPQSSLGVLLHLSSQAATHPDPVGWALDFLNSFDLDDM